jgi:hypothetical protein
VSIRLLNCHTRNPSRSCISRSTSQSHSLSDSISQRASLFTYHLVRVGYSPTLPSRFTRITWKPLVNSPTDYASSGSGSVRRTVTFAELATDQTQLTSSRACHRHVTPMHSTTLLHTLHTPTHFAHSSTLCTLLHTLPHSTTPHYTPHTLPHLITLHHTPPHSYTPQHTPIHSITLQHTPSHFITLWHTSAHSGTLWHTPIHSSTLQHTSSHSSTPQHNPPQPTTLYHTFAHSGTLLYTPAHSSTL